MFSFLFSTIYIQIYYMPMKERRTSKIIKRDTFKLLKLLNVSGNSDRKFEEKSTWATRKFGKYTKSLYIFYRIVPSEKGI